MKKQTRILRNGSARAAVSQPKTSQGRAVSRPPSGLPKFLGPFVPGRDDPLCLCLFDRYSNCVAAKVPLTDDELSALLRPTLKRGVSGLEFIAAALRVALFSTIDGVTKQDTASKPASPTYYPSQPTPEVGLETAHDRLEMIVPEVVAALSLLSDAYWEVIDHQNEHQRTVANGLFSLACTASSRLETEFPLSCSEWLEARRAAA
jgi:hypothetical protein